MLSRNQLRSPALHCVEQLEARHLLSSTVIPIAGASEFIYDNTRQLLYFPAGTALQRFDIASRSLTAPITGVGTALGGGDITLDGSRLYLADNVFVSGGYGTTYLRKIDLATSTVTSIPVAGAGPYHTMAAGYDFAVGASGQGFLTIRDDSDMIVEFNTADDTYRYRTDFDPPGASVSRPNMRASRSDDGNLLMLIDVSDSGGRIYTFDSASDAFLPRKSLGTFNGAIDALNADASRIAIEGSNASGGVYAMDGGWHSLASFGTGSYISAAFAPSGNLIYLADSSTSELVAFDISGALPLEKFRIKASTPFSKPDKAASPMRVSPDGKQVWLLDAGNLQVFDVPQPNAAIAATFKIDGTNPFSPIGYQQTVTLTAYDPVGNIATGYRGTVRLRSTDVHADLPADYTFTAADNGSHTFTYRQNTVGAHTLSATDLSSGVTATQSNIQTHNGNVSLIPFFTTKFVWNEATHLLFLAGNDILRYDPIAQVMLPSLHVGAGGFDVTSDGKTIYAAGQSGPFDATMRKIDIATDTVTSMRYSMAGVINDLAVFDNGKGFATVGLAGGDNKPMLDIDLISGTVGISASKYGRYPYVNTGEINKSADGQSAFGLSSSGPLYIYDAATNTFPYDHGLGTGYEGAISRDGGIVAYRTSFNTYVMDRTFTTTFLTLSGAGYAMAFNAAAGRNEFYYVAPEGDRITAYDTNSWAAKYSFAVGTDLSSGFQSRSIVDNAGRFLFLYANGGVRVYPLVTRPVITVANDFVASPIGTVRSITANALLPDGTVDVSYRGTVHFTSSDPTAVLPADYTFTAADNGTKTFNVTLKTAGRQTITMTDVTSGGPALPPSVAERWVTGASLKSDGTLAILGTSSRDVINISRTTTTIGVTFGTVNASFPLASVKNLTIDALDGDDSVTLADGIPGGWIDLDQGNDTLLIGSATGTVAGASVGFSIGGGDGNDVVTLNSGAAPVRFLGDTLASTSTLSNRIVIAGSPNDDQLTSSGFSIPLSGVSRTALALSRLGGAGSPVDVELAMIPSLTFTGGNGNDSLDTSGLTLEGVNTLTFQGEGGDDSLVGLAGPGGTGVAKGITDATFSGGPGTDTVAWTYGSAAGNLSVLSSSTSDTVATLRYDTIENLTIDAGAGNDTFTVSSIPAGTVPLLLGGAGNDRINIASTLVGGAVVRFDGGADTDTVSFAASAAATALTLVSDRTYDANKTVYDQNVEAIELVGSSSADQFNVAPRATATISVLGNSPTTTPGDKLSVDTLGVTNVTHTPGATGTGQITSGNRQPITYTGIESVPDVFAPWVTSAQYNPATSPQMMIAVAFSEDVSSGISKSSLQLKNQATNQFVSVDNATFTYSNWAATWTFPPDSLLPTANYEATILASTIEDAALNFMQSNYAFRFFVLAGDGDGDRVVGIKDFNILAANFGKTGQSFSQGNYDYSADGKIDILDFNILAADFGKHLDPPVAPTQPVIQVQSRSIGEINSTPTTSHWLNPQFDDTNLLSDVGLM